MTRLLLLESLARDPRVRRVLQASPVKEVASPARAAASRVKEVASRVKEAAALIHLRTGLQVGVPPDGASLRHGVAHGDHQAVGTMMVGTMTVGTAVVPPASLARVEVASPARVEVEVASPVKAEVEAASPVKAEVADTVVTGRTMAGPMMAGQTMAGKATAGKRVAPPASQERVEAEVESQARAVVEAVDPVLTGTVDTVTDLGVLHGDLLGVNLNPKNPQTPANLAKDQKVRGSPARGQRVQASPARVLASQERVLASQERARHQRHPKTGLRVGDHPNGDHRRHGVHLHPGASQNGTMTDGQAHQESPARVEAASPARVEVEAASQEKVEAANLARVDRVDQVIAAKDGGEMDIATTRSLHGKLLPRNTLLRE
mmetsp:Transcript_1027/g.2314  ORF Transcript_1027/g.2314 Transcript_1027/m.2314 type:complete len:376 (-) Transcript_1027:166-1293(-)